MKRVTVLFWLTVALGALATRDTFGTDDLADMVLILGSFCGGDSDIGENWNCRDRRKSGYGCENVGRGRLHVAAGLHWTPDRRVSGAVKQGVDFFGFIRARYRAFLAVLLPCSADWPGLASGADR